MEKKQKLSINQSKVKKIAIPGLILLLGVGGIKGYQKINQNTQFYYTIDDNNNFEAQGKVKYNEVKKWKLVEKQLRNEKTELFIIDTDFFSDEAINVLTGTRVGYILTYGDDSILNAYDLEEYLITYHAVKAYYEKEDIEKLLEQIKQDYEEIKSNQKTK